MTTSEHSVAYGQSEISFLLNFKDRKTLAIHVYPDHSVVVDAPINTSLQKVKNRIIKRAKWIRKQQRYFERFPPALPIRKYVSGEAFRYLGRQYTLTAKIDPINSIKMYRGRLYVCTTSLDPKHIKKLVDAWYRDKATSVFADRFSQCEQEVTKHLGIKHKGRFTLRTMKTRWGSCSKKHLITLNPELLAAPKECIDYVITHELCHLKEHNHSQKFYRLLDKVMPDWAERKDKLERMVEHRII